MDRRPRREPEATVETSTRAAGLHGSAFAPRTASRSVLPVGVARLIPQRPWKPIRDNGSPLSWDVVCGSGRSGSGAASCVGYCSRAKRRARSRAASSWRARAR
jgi:hypothetical protein